MISFAVPSRGRAPKSVASPPGASSAIVPLLRRRRRIGARVTGALISCPSCGAAKTAPPGSLNALLSGSKTSGAESPNATNRATRATAAASLPGRMFCICGLPRRMRRMSRSDLVSERGNLTQSSVTFLRRPVAFLVSWGEGGKRGLACTHASAISSRLQRTV